MGKKLKKSASLFFAIYLCLSVFFSGRMLSATAATPSEIMPMYNNTSCVSSNIGISSSGQLTIYYDYTGFPGKTSKAVITTYIERKTLGLFWKRVENGQTNNEWVDTKFGVDCSYFRVFQLPSSGTYRVTVTYQIYGSGGAADNIKCVMKDSY